ncbi:EamA family transporter [Streptomyces sp. SID5785]|uniref:DMT family transporter n=1 Tax=Streptomyces sp. SID5785 TaxID=2690309 RepID=UPI0013612746|nr:DMT family transporter [Streptomyces sp. SID5785]MZD05006.1 EamA family transporter [Streptomyces sp. SID5785]
MRGRATSVATGLAVLLVGFSWAMESFLGKLSLNRGYSTFDFPLVLNLGTVAVCLAACLRPGARRQVLDVPRDRVVTLGLVSLTLVFVPYLVIYLALGTLSPAETSLISSMTPLFSLVVGAVWLGVRMRPRAASCVALGFGGVCVLIVPEVSGPAQDGKAVWYLVMLLAPLSYAVSGFLIRRAARLGAGALQLLLATNALPLVLFAVLNRGFALPAGARAADLAVFGAGIVFNVVAVTGLMRLSTLLSPLALSFSNYATVLFAFLLTARYLDEPLGPRVVVAGVLVVVSSLLVTGGRQAGRAPSG